MKTQRIKGGMINEEKRRKFKTNLVRALLIPMVTGCHLLTHYLCMTVLVCFNKVYKQRQSQRERNRRMHLKLWLAGSTIIPKEEGHKKVTV